MSLVARGWFLVGMCLLSSCGLLRNVHREKSEVRSSMVVEVKKDSVGMRVDRSTLTKVERIDTVVTVPEQVVKQDQVVNMDSLVNGIMAIQNDLVDVKLSLNPATGIMSAVATLKARSVAVVLDRTMTEQRDITESATTHSELNSKKNTSESHSQVDRSGLDIPWYVWIIGVLICGVMIWYWGRKNKY